MHCCFASHNAKSFCCSSLWEKAALPFQCTLNSLFQKLLRRSGKSDQTSSTPGKLQDQSCSSLLLLHTSCIPLYSIPREHRPFPTLYPSRKKDHHNSTLHPYCGKHEENEPTRKCTTWNNAERVTLSLLLLSKSVFILLCTLYLMLL